MIWMSVPCPFPRFICWNLNSQCDGIRRQGLLHHEGGVQVNEIVVVQSPRHARPLCPSSSPKVCPSSCPLHRWWYPAISSSDTLFSFCPQSFPASGTLPMSQLLASGDQNTGVSTSASVLPMSVQGWFPLRLTDLCNSRDFMEPSPAPQFEGINSSELCLPYYPAVTTLHGHWEDHSLDYTDLCYQSNKNQCSKWN